MRAAPIANDDEVGTVEDEMVADPLADETERLWNDTARTNREIFTECFRPVPTNLIRSWDAYEVRLLRYSPFIPHAYIILIPRTTSPKSRLTMPYLTLLWSDLRIVSRVSRVLSSRLHW